VVHHAKALLTQPTVDGDNRSQIAYISHPALILTSHDDIQGQLDIVRRLLKDRLDEFTNVEGSGWILDNIVCIDVNIAAYDQILGSGYIKTPAQLLSKRTILNIHNKDHKCFFYSI